MYIELMHRPAQPELEPETEGTDALELDELYRAGRWVLPGVYQDGSGRLVALARGGRLPASLDGKVACYRRVRSTWGEIERQEGERRESEHLQGERRERREVVGAS